MAAVRIASLTAELSPRICHEAQKEIQEVPRIKACCAVTFYPIRLSTWREPSFPGMAASCQLTLSLCWFCSMAQLNFPEASVSRTRTQHPVSA